MTSTLGPYKVGEELIATCVTSAGKIEINVGELKSGKFMYNDILQGDQYVPLRRYLNRQ